MTKRIVIITPYYAPAWGYGGPPKVLSILAQELIKLGCSVTVLTTDTVGLSRSKRLFEKIDGVEVYRIPLLSNILAYRYKFFFAPHFLKRVSKHIDKADIVLFSDLRTIINWQVADYIKRLRKPYGIFPFGQIQRDQGIKGMMKILFDRLWVSDFVEMATFRFAQTEHEQKQYGKMFNISIRKTNLLLLPVETKSKPVHNTKVTKEMRRWGIVQEDKVYIFVGRIHYLKGIDISLEAFKELIPKHKNIKFLIVGRDDGDEIRLKSLIPNQLKSNIIFTGPLYNQQLYSLFSYSYCFIITPRFYEETSMAALEALACGVPVISSQEASVPFLEEENAGILVENDQKRIIKAIKDSLNFNMSIMRKNALRLIRNYYQAEKVGLQLYRSIISKKNN